MGIFLNQASKLPIEFGPMFNVAVEHKGAYLLVVGSGSAELPELSALADFVATAASARNCKRVLIDLLAVERDLSPAEHAQLVSHMARRFGRLERIASVHAHSRAFPGLPVRTFTNLPEASDWLLGE